MIIIIVISSLNLIVKSRYKMLSYAGYVDPESTLAIEVHHDGNLEDTERTFCSLFHTLMFPPSFAIAVQYVWFIDQISEENRVPKCSAQTLRRVLGGKSFRCDARCRGNERGSGSVPVSYF